MLGDGAVAVHPDDERYAPIVGKMVRLPLADRLIPIITDEYPDPDFGSGAVKITGAHDFNDYEVAKLNDIPMYSLMGTRGEMIASEIMPEKYVGMDRFKARKAVVADIDAEGLLIRVEDKKIMQPYGDRSNVVIEPMLTDQWFVDAEKLAGEAVAAVDRGHADKNDVIPHKGESPQMRDPSESVNASEDTQTSGPASQRQRRTVRDDNEDKGATRFIPENWKKTYDHWMENIQPWCISRQLWWGHQIPAWFVAGGSGDWGTIDKLDPDIFDELRPTVAASREEAIEKIIVRLHESPAIKFVEETVDPDAQNWEHLRAVEKIDFLFTTVNDEEGHIAYYRDGDVLDTWFSSGLWPFSTLGWPEKTDELERFYPTSTLVTGFDIIFFWVARMMMQGLHLDEQGKKMSKSIGNTLDPLDLIDGVSIDKLIEKRTRGLKNPDKAPQVAKATKKAYPDGFEAYGADALRFTLASQAGQGRNVRLSVDRIAGYRNFGTKLWSAANFGQMNGCTSAEGFAPSSATLPVNKWIISETAKTAAEITRCIDAYRFNDAADAVYKFTWDTFCAWYLELSKPLLSGENGPEKDETRATFAWVLDQILKLLHPFMPFITEDLWAKVTTDRDGHLITADWPTYGDDLIDGDAVAELDWLKTLITNIRSVRADMNIPPAKKAPLLLCADTLDPRLATYAPQLSPMARVEVVELAASVPDNALQTVVDGVQYAIPLAGLIDMDAERKRLSKEIEKAQSEIEKIDKKLSNEAFVAKAPEKVVNLQKERRAGYVAEVKTLQAALDGLG